MHTKTKVKCRYVYGPVFSWRLNRSLGIDPISQKRKICSFNCRYCQVKGKSIFTVKRRVFVPLSAIIKELKTLPQFKADFITFSGRGEPTLAKNLGAIIRAVKGLRKEPVAVLTNSTLLHRKRVREELKAADRVIAKLDAASTQKLVKINQPARSISFSKILKGLMDFRKMYRGILGLQVMFVSENKAEVKKLVKLCAQIRPDLIYLNTPLRPNRCRPLSKKEMMKIKKEFSKTKTVCVYDKIKGMKIRALTNQAALKARGR
ncbi:MAG: radical SAM protein [Candidatus Omnitrophica bacterium]|nr:radical SAM protein [Candidatus Omnitrophota bacterium]MBU1925443.1 radical SAM protein [Candidatus Omnitrophota bacterium]